MMDNQVDRYYTLTDQTTGPWYSSKFFLIFAVLIFISAILGSSLFFLNQKRSKAVVPETKITTPPSLLLSSGKLQYQVGEIIPVNVQVSTGENLTTGIDVNLYYPKDIVEATSSGITAGNIFTEFPLKSVNPPGFIRMSQVAGQSDSEFKGDGNFATVYFVAKKAGIAPIQIEFTPLSTADSNIVGSGSGSDLLEKVQDVTIEIK